MKVSSANCRSPKHNPYRGDVFSFQLASFLYNKLNNLVDSVSSTDRHILNIIRTRSLRGVTPGGGVIVIKLSDVKQNSVLLECLPCHHEEPALLLG